MILVNIVLTVYISHVVLSVAAYTRARQSVVSVDEGSSVNITCNSVGIPAPTITWWMNDQLVPLTPIESITDPTERGFSSFLQDIMLGSINSTIEIVDAQYPENNGTYICIGTNEINSSSDSSISVQVVGMYGQHAECVKCWSHINALSIY